VVNVSSGLGSLTLFAPAPADIYPGVAYPASKAAINMITVQYAKAFPNLRINAVDPGFTKTDLNGNTGTQTVEQGAEIIVQWRRLTPTVLPGASSTPKAACPGNGNVAAACVARERNRIGRIVLPD
jgi:NAD(P)-dependent dehydrogenase (short-subunit alcohol dehydrogenase family)